jgi:hypothetical protein
LRSRRPRAFSRAAIARKLKTYRTSLDFFDQAIAAPSMKAAPEARLPPLLSVIAGMVDLTGFFTLGNIFTAHVAGNLVVIAAS